MKMSQHKSRVAKATKKIRCKPVTLIRIVSNVAKRFTATLFPYIILLNSNLALADMGQLIPISHDDQTSGSTNAAQTFVKIICKDVIPLILVAAAVFIIYSAITGILTGMKDSQKEGKFEPLKDALIKAAIVVVVGGALIYMLSQVPTLANVK